MILPYEDPRSLTDQSHWRMSAALVEGQNTPFCNANFTPSIYDYDSTSPFVKGLFYTQMSRVVICRPKTISDYVLGLYKILPY